MKHIKTIQKSCLRESLHHGGRGEGPASCPSSSSCQSACKTSCTVANQACARKSEQA